MAVEITLPELGENVEGGDVVDIKVAAGAEVKPGQVLLEVEAEKSTVEVPSPSAGRISKVLVKTGQQVTTGQPLFLLDPVDGAAQGVSSPAQVGQKPQPIKKVQTAPQPPKSPISTPTAPVAPRPAAPATVPTATPESVPEKKNDARPATVIPAGPGTRRLARELGVDLARVHGTALGGRVTAEDIKRFVKELASAEAPVAASAGAETAPLPPLPDFGKWGPVERRAIDAVRRKTAQQVALAWRVIPHVTQHDQADVTDLEAFRKQQDSRGPKLTVTAFALKASAIALKQFPQFNSTLDLANNQLILKQYYHVGLAVDTERGLLVPVVRDVDKKSVHDVAKEMAELADRARQKKLTGDEMRGGTFTITNLGSIGGTSFTQIINYPEVAILGMSRASLQPVCREGGLVVARLILPLSVTYDHRVIDGADAARFLRCIVEMLENPLVMLLHA